MKRSTFIFLFFLFFLALTFSNSSLSVSQAQETEYLQVDKLTQTECGPDFTDKPLTLLSGGNPVTYHHCTKYSALKPGEPYLTNSYIKIGELCEDRDGDGQEDLSASFNAYTINDKKTGIFLCYTTSQTATADELITSSTLITKDETCPANSDLIEEQIYFKDANGNTLKHCVSEINDKSKRTKRANYCVACGSCAEGDHPRCGDDLPQSEYVTPYQSYLYNCEETSTGFLWIRGERDDEICGEDIPPTIPKPPKPPQPPESDPECRPCILGDLKWGKDLSGAFLTDHCYYCSIDYDSSGCNEWVDQGDKEERQGICGGVRFDSLIPKQRPAGCFGQRMEVEEPKPSVPKPEEPIEIYLGGHSYKIEHSLSSANWLARDSDISVLSNTENCGRIRAEVKPEIHGNADFVAKSAESAEKTVRGYLPQFKITDFIPAKVILSGDNDDYKDFNVKVFMTVLGNEVSMDVRYDYKECLDHGFFGGCKKWTGRKGSKLKSYNLADDKIPVFIKEATTPPELGFIEARVVSIIESSDKKFDKRRYNNIIQNCP